MIPSNIESEIQARLTNAEQEHNVRIVYAVESGSRAWGFASVNSDYDVRFIYAHEPDWYLRVDLEDLRDVIEYPIVDEIDINGWDIRKALKLFWHSNPAFVEWLQSPIIYRDIGPFAHSARNLLPDIYSVEKGVYHYRSMAKNNYRGYLRETMVPLKKYFYVLRPLLAIRWLEQHRKPAPIEFDTLRKLLSDQPTLDKAVHDLLERKKNSTEKEHIPAVTELNDFIEHELQRLEDFQLSPSRQQAGIEQLNALFTEVIRR